MSGDLLMLVVVAARWTIVARGGLVLLLLSGLRLWAGRLRLRAILIQRRMNIVILVARADGWRVAIPLLNVVLLDWRGSVVRLVARRCVAVALRLIRIAAVIAVVVVHGSAAIPVIRRRELAEAAVVRRLIIRRIVASVWRALLFERAGAIICDGHGVVCGRRLNAAVILTIIIRGVVRAPVFA